MKRIMAVILIAAAVSTACTKVAQDKDKVQAALDATEQLARSYVYTENASGLHIVVTGAIKDDLRYRVDASVDGQPIASEVVYDDTRALKFENAAGGSIILPSTTSANGQKTQPVTLQAGVWLADPKGAASLLLRAPSRSPGRDPLADSLTALEYVRYALSQAQGVFKFNPESENYRPKLDPFPRPAPGVIRYDLVPPDLPARQRVGTGQNIGLLNQVPGVAFFRLMAVYVKDGLVQDVREQIAIEPRLADSQSNLEARLNDFTNGAKASQPLSYQAAALLFSINQKLAHEGQPLIRPRTMDLRFSGFGKPQDVTLPAGATPADLSSLGSYDLELYESR